MIFKDINKLSPRYIPERLPHREKDIEELLMFFHPQLNTILPVQVIGPVGCGKTSVSISTGRKLVKRSFKPLYINLKIANNKFFIYNSLLEQLSKGYSSRNLGPEEILAKLINIIRKRKIKAYIILDEIGYYVKSTRDSSIIYDLTRVNEISPQARGIVLGIVFIARDLGWYKVLDASERSSLGNIILNLEPYTKDQLIDILEYRVSEAFNPGSIDFDVIDYIADITVKEASSDVRYALDLLQYAGILAERRGDIRVTLDHVRHVLSRLNPYITSEDLYTLSEAERLALLALAYILRRKSVAYASFTEIFDEFKLVQEEYLGKTKYRIKAFENAIQTMQDKGIIVFMGVKRLGINAPTDRLIPFLERIIESLSNQF